MAAGRDAARAWGAVAVGLLRMAAVFVGVLAAIAVAALLTVRVLSPAQAGGEGSGGYADSFLPAVRADLLSFPAEVERAETLALHDRDAAAARLADLALHERAMMDAAVAQPVPPGFANAHHELLALYSEVLRAAQAATECLLAGDPHVPACTETANLQRALPQEAERVIAAMEAAAEDLRALAGLDGYLPPRIPPEEQ